MPLLKRRRVFAAKIESTVGTAETLAAADGAFNVYDLMIQPTIEVENRPAQGSFNQLPGVPGARLGTATFRTDVGYSGSGVPSWSALLPACGWVNSSGTFSPKSRVPGVDGVSTVTIGGYVDGLYKQIYGAMGNWRAICPNGRLASIEWTFQGLWSAPTDTSLIAPTYPTEQALRYAAATSTFDSESLCVETITFDAGNTIKMIECGDSLTGYKHACITDRLPMVTANPEATLVADNNRYGKWLSSTEGVLSVSLPGPSTSTVEFRAPKAQVRNIQEGDREGLVVDDVEWSCNQNGTTADEELQVIFTASS
ncbi:MAG: hypothetical protein AAGJ40_02875 [Planctomycetota bacterium]